MALQEDLDELTRMGWGPDRFAELTDALDQVMRFQNFNGAERRLILNCLHPRATSGDLLAVIAHNRRVELTKFLVLAKRSGAAPHPELLPADPQTFRRQTPSRNLPATESVLLPPLRGGLQGRHRDPPV
jgi:hypothetical protein